MKPHRNHGTSFCSTSFLYHVHSFLFGFVLGPTQTCTLNRHTACLNVSSNWNRINRTLECMNSNVPVQLRLLSCLRIESMDPRMAHLAPVRLVLDQDDRYLVRPSGYNATWNSFFVFIAVHVVTVHVVTVIVSMPAVDDLVTHTTSQC